MSSCQHGQIIPQRGIVAPEDCGLMEIEHLIRYAPLAVGLKPSARQGEARLRGLYRIIYSKTIISP